MEFSGFNSDIVAGRIQNLTSVAGEYLKEAIGQPVIEEWVGMRPMVYDDLPIIGRAPNQRNLLIASGHGMSGISMATGTGKLVTEIITGREPHIDPAAFGVNRFYSGCQKNVPVFKRFFLQPLMPHFRISEHYYGKRYNT